MGNKVKKQARRVAKRTAKTVKKWSASVAPVLAGVAAGLAARDVAGPSSSYLQDVGRDLARLMRTISIRAASVVHAEPSETGPEHSSGSHEQTA